MRFGKRLLSVFLIAACLASTLLIAPAASAETAAASKSAGESFTKKKVVSVLYDTSASMHNRGEPRYLYAKYAMQMLMSMLGTEDSLFVTPMHDRNSGWKEVGQGSYQNASFEVDLKNPNRDGQIVQALSNTFLSEVPNGNSTPSAAIEWAVQHLVNNGMKTHAETSADEESNTEYYLVVLTDGELDTAKNLQTIANAFQYYSGVDKYASYQCIYLAFSSEAADLKGTSLDSFANFTPYAAKNTEGLIASMQEVANQISGRYALDKSAYKVSGNTVTVDLSGVAFGLRSVSLMLQNCAAKLTSASYNGEALPISLGTTISSVGLDGMQNGSTAVIRRTGDTGKFSGGQLTLTFNGNVDASGLSILLEPSLTLTPIVEKTENGGYLAVDSQYINANMKKDDKVYVSFSITDEASGNIVNLPDAEAKVSYNGTTQAITGAGRAEVSLALGYGNISVSVSVLGGAYTMYASIPCVVLENPSFFRVEAGKTESISETEKKTLFTVFDNNVAVSDNTALSAFNPVVTFEAEDGTPLPTSAYTVSYESGKIACYLKASGLEYGAYTISVTVRDAKGNPRSVEAGVPYYPTGIEVAPEGEDTLSLSHYDLSQNESAGRGFTFALTSNGKSFPFIENLFEYTVKVGSLDVTASCQIVDGKLVFVPTEGNLASLASGTGDYTVSVSVKSDAAGVDTSCTATLTVKNTVFEVVPITADKTPVNRFRPGKSNSELYFRVLRDGVSLSAEELTAALESGLLSINSASFAVIATEQTIVENKDGAPAVCVRMCSGQGPLPFLLSGMFVFGDGKEIKLTYGSVTGEDTVPLVSPSIFQYVIRVLIYLYLIQLLIVLLTFKNQEKVKRIPEGILVRLSLVDKDGKRKSVESVRVMKVVTLREHLILKRLIPYIGLLPAFQKKDVTTSVGTLTYTDTGLRMRSSRACVEAEIKTRDGNNPIATRAKQKFSNSKAKAGTLRFEPAELNNMWVEATSQTTEAAKLSRLGTMSGPILNDNLYLFIEKNRYSK